jgi:integrase
MPRSVEGSIYKTPDGKRWFARLRYTDANGQPREKKRTCTSHAQARDMIRRLRDEVERDTGGQGRTWRDLDAFYRAHYATPARFVDGKLVSGVRSLHTMRLYLDRALAYFGDRELASITYADVREYKRHVENTRTRTGGQRSITDINHHLKRVRRLLTVAVEQGWIDVNPFKRGGALIRETFETERTRVLTPGEEAKLLAACIDKREHLRPIVIFAIETACRRGEIRRLLWSDINLTGRVIRIQATNTKTLKPRMVPISARLRETLAQLRPNSPVFPSGDFKRSFETACRITGLDDVHFHDLRHTAITRMIEAGLPSKMVMKISGHLQLKTFMRYLNQTEENVYDLALQMDAAAERRRANVVNL